MRPGRIKRRLSGVGGSEFIQVTRFHERRYSGRRPESPGAATALIALRGKRPTFRMLNDDTVKLNALELEAKAQGSSG
jgi:hypothetical protein